VRRVGQHLRLLGLRLGLDLLLLGIRRLLQRRARRVARVGWLARRGKELVRILMAGELRELEVARSSLSLLAVIADMESQRCAVRRSRSSNADILGI
jgi:hypothetical protein